MNWFGSLSILVVVGSSYLTTASVVPKKGVSLNCTEHISLCDDDWFNYDQILGNWYQVSEERKEVFCLNFEKLTAKKRISLETDLRDSLNETDFSRFSLIVTRKCPELIMFNDTEFHLMAELDDKGVFDTFLGNNNSSRLIHLTPVHMKLVTVEGEQYLLSQAQGYCLILNREPKKYNIDQDKKQPPEDQ